MRGYLKTGNTDFKKPICVLALILFQFLPVNTFAQSCWPYEDSLNWLGEVSYSSDFPDPGNEVVIDGGWAYATSGLNIQVIELGHESGPYVWNPFYTGSRVIGLEFDPDRSLLFAADESGEVLVLSPDPTRHHQLIQIGSAETLDDPNGISREGQFIYLATDSGLEIFDVSEPSSPVRFGHHDTTWKVYDVEVVAGMAYTSINQDGFRIIDVSDPGSPVPLGVVAPAIGENVTEILVAEGRAYYAGYGGMQVIDVSDPHEPSTLPDNLGNIGDVRGLVLNGGFAFLSGRLGSEPVLAVVNLETLNLWSWLPALGSVVPETRMAGHLALAGQLIFTISEGVGLRIADVGGLVMPPSALSLRTTPTSHTLMAVQGQLALIGTYFRLEIYDVSDPTDFVLLGTNPEVYFPQDIAFNGDLAYVADLEMGLRILDISDPSDPVILGTVTTPDWPASVAVAFPYCFVADHVRRRFHAIDVSDPTNPTIIGSYPSGTPSSGGYYSSIALHDQRAYVVHGEQLMSFDISDPSAPALVSGANIGPNGSDIEIVGDLAFVTGDGGLHIFNGVYAGDLHLLGKALPGTWGDLLVHGDRAYVSGIHGLTVYDVENPEAPWVLGASYDSVAPTNNHHLALLGGNLVSAGKDGVATYHPQCSPVNDTRLPAAPNLLSADVINGLHINLEWMDNSDGEQRFVIERRIGLDGTWQFVGETTGDWTSWIDDTALVGFPNFYKVRAWNARGFSEFSNTVYALPMDPRGSLRGVVFEDLNGNESFDLGVDSPIANAQVFLNERLKATTNADGQYAHVSPNLGEWNNIWVGAPFFQSRFLDQIQILEGSTSIIDIALEAVEPANLRVTEVGRLPDLGPASLGKGGIGHIHFQVSDASSNEPVGLVPISVEINGYPIGDFSADVRGVADITFDQSYLPDNGTPVEMRVVSVADHGHPLHLQPIVPIRMVPTTVEWVLDSKSAGSLGIASLYADREYRFRLALRSQWLPGQTQPQAPSELQIERISRLGAGVSGGISGGLFFSGIDGPQTVNAGFHLGAEAKAGLYSERQEKYTFAWPPSTADAATMLLVLVDGLVEESVEGLDLFLINILVHAADELLIEPILAQAAIGDGYLFGAQAGANIQATIATPFSPDHPLSLGGHASLGGSGGVFCGGTTISGGSREEFFYGSTTQAHAEYLPGNGLEGPSTSAPKLVGQKVVDLIFPNALLYGSSEFSSRLFVSRTSPGPWEELGLESSSLIFSDGIGTELSTRMTTSYTPLVSGNFPELPRTLPPLLSQAPLTSYFVLGGLDIVNTAVELAEIVARIEQAAESGAALHFSQTQTDPIRAREATVGISVPFAASFNLSYKLWSSRRGPAGSWTQIGDRLFTTSEYAQLPNVAEIPLEDVLETIINALDPVIWGNAFHILEIPFAKQKSEQSFTLADGNSSLSLDPAWLPPGTMLREVFWTWNNDVQMGSGIPGVLSESSYDRAEKTAEDSFGFISGIGGYHQLEPEGTELAQPATLVLAYDDAELDGFPESGLGVFFEDKEAHRLIPLGGVTDPVQNTVTVQISTLRNFTLAPNQPHGEISVTALPDSLGADGNSTATLTAQPLLNSDGTQVPDGTLYTVSATRGVLTAADADTQIAGIQIPSQSGSLIFDLQAPHEPFASRVMVSSVSGFAAGADSVFFLNTDSPNPPTGLTAAGSGMNAIVLQWLPGPEQDLAGYRVHFDTDEPIPPFDGLAAYYALPSPIDVGPDTCLTILGLDPTTTYYLTVTSYDLGGMESPFADPVVVKSTTDAGSAVLPSVTELRENFPNPFNPTTTIEFSLPASSIVSLRVYDVRGRLINTLVDSERAAGRHKVAWHGEDNLGNPVASGVYLYVLKAGDLSLRKKMLVLR